MGAHGHDHGHAAQGHDDHHEDHSVCVKVGVFFICVVIALFFLAR